MKNKICVLMLVSLSFNLVSAQEDQTLWEMLVGSEKKSEEPVDRVIANYHQALEDVESVISVTTGRVNSNDDHYLHQVQEWLEQSVSSLSTAENVDEQLYQSALDKFYAGNFNDFVNKYQVQEALAVREVIEETEEIGVFDILFDRESARQAGKQLSQRAIASIDRAVKRS